MAEYLDARKNPCAHSVQIFSCGQDGCGQPHLVLFDGKDNVIASASISLEVVERLVCWYASGGDFDNVKH